MKFGIIFCRKRKDSLLPRTILRGICDHSMVGPSLATHSYTSAVVFKVKYIYTYFITGRYILYHRTLRGLIHVCRTPRARRGGVPRAGGRSPRTSGDVCAEPFCLEGSRETRGLPSSVAWRPQIGTCSGGGIGRKSRAERSTVNYFRFGWTRVCIRESICTE